MGWEVCIVLLTLIIIYMFGSHVPIGYGSMDQVCLEEMRRGLTPKIISQLDNILSWLSPPPSNNSDATWRELKYLQRMVYSTPAECKKTARKLDKNALVELQEYAIREKLTVNSRLEDTLRETRVIVLALKFHFNRPRPHQLGWALGVPVCPLPSTVSNSPSYPSYHTLAAYVYAEILARDNPNHHKRLMNLAERVRLSREVGGWNYPSDNDASILLAGIIVRRV
jgi:hypothetical protein